MKPLHCRFCDTPLRHSFADLGSTPLANSYLDENDLLLPEEFFELHARVCHECFLVQLPEMESAEAIFGDYAYFSSYSDSWLRHAEDYVKLMEKRFMIDQNSQSSRVVDSASKSPMKLHWFSSQTNSPFSLNDPST